MTTCFLLFCLLTGWSLVRFLGTQLEKIAVASGYIIGQLIWVLMMMLSFAFFTKANTAVSLSMTIFILFGITLILYSIYKKSPSKNEYLYLLLAFVLFFLVLPISNYSSFQGSSDYRTILMMGYETTLHGIQGKNIAYPFLRSFGIFIPMSQVPILFLSKMHSFFNLVLLSAISLYALLACGLYHSFYRSGKSHYYALMISLLLSLFMFSSYFMEFLSIAIKHHLFTAALMLLYVLLIDMWTEQEIKNPLSLLTLISLGLLITRAEGMLYVFLFSVCFIRNPIFSYKNRLYYTLSIALLSSLYFLFLAHFGKTDSTIMLTKHVMIFLITLQYLFLFYVLLSKTKLIKYIESNRNLIISLLGVALMLTTLLIAPTHMLNSWVALISNLFGDSSYWGITWYFIAGWFLLTALKNPNMLRSDLYILLYAMVIFIAASVILRMPYKSASVDSGSRMFVHCLPLAIYMLSYYWSQEHKLTAKQLTLSQ